jgi:hypothetical protein
MSHKLTTLFVLLCLTTGCLNAQTIQLILPPNPSPYISDWQTTPGAATLIINNTQNKDIDVKIKTELFNGSGEMLAHTQASKMPVLTVPPGLSTYNVEDIFPLSAVSYNGGKVNIVAQSGRIPDDHYRFCVYLTDPLTGSPIGQSVNECKGFVIKAYQAPVLIAPHDLETIPQVGINGMIFRWTPVTPSANIIVTYRLQIWEVLEGQNNVTALRTNQPIVEKDLKGILQTQWPVEFALPEVGRSYVWTVTPLDDQERKLVDGYGFAQPFGFTVGPSLRTLTSTNGTAEVGDVIKAGLNGEFEVTVTQISTETDGSLTGKGKAKVNWLGVPVAVEFSKIKIDNNKQLTAGGIAAVKGGSTSTSWTTYPQAWALGLLSSQQAANIVDGVVNWTNNTINDIVDGVINNSLNLDPPIIHYNSNIAPPALPDNSLKMPFGLQFNNGDQKLVITEMVFKPNESKINFIAQEQFSKSGTQYKLGFAGKYFKIHPGSVEFANGRVELAEDITVPNTSANPKMEFTFLKGGTSTGCYIQWSANGISDIGLGLDISFTRDWLIPIPSATATSKVKASISGNGTSLKDILLTGNLPNCEIVGTNGMKIQANQISLDLSDIRNPDQIQFPKNYPTTPGLDWQGFYMKSFGLTLPDTWKTGTNQNPPSITATNLIIDDMGLTTSIKALDIFNLQSGNVANLSASLDTVEVSIICGSLVSGKAKGKLVLPISEAVDQNTLKYTASFSQAAGAGKFQIVIVPYQAIEASILRGKVNLNPTSNITASLSSGTVSVSMTLNGSFIWNSPDLKPTSNNIGGSLQINTGGIKGIKMEMDFENVSLSYSYAFNTETDNLTFNCGNWSFASPQKRVANFPVTIKKIYYKSLTTTSSGNIKELLRGALMLDIVVNLTEEIGGSTSLGAAFSIGLDKTAKKLKPAFVGVIIEKISIHADLSAVKIDGSLEMRKNDPKFGDGFLATLGVTFTAVSLQINALAEFGNTTYQSPDGKPYRYWRVEADVMLPVGIPFLTGVGFYGFGGGAFYNMEPLQITSIANPGNTAYTFEPKKSTLGFQVKATIGTMPSFDTFNADVSLLAAFSTSGGLIEIGFLGNFWLAASLPERASAKIMGSVAVSYNFPDKLFFMAAGLSINVPPAITTPSPVGFVMSINGRTNKWYFKSGTPDATNTVRIFNIDLYSYLMVGNDIPTPNGFTQRFSNKYRNATGSYPNSGNVGPGGVGSNTTTGKGFATGIGIEFPPKDVSQDLYKGSCRRWSVGGTLLAGAELNLALMHQTGCTGINGYRASGNIGLYASVNASINGSGYRWGCGDKSINLFKIQAGAWLEGKFPNPEYAAGSISANIDLFDGLCQCTYNKSFQYGTNCNGTTTTVSNAPKQDRADSLRNKLIQYIAPLTQSYFPISSPVNVKYALVPDQLFDVAENEGDGTVINRTFKLDVSASLEIRQKNGAWAKSNLFSKVNNMGEFQYYRLGASKLLKAAYENYKVKSAGILKKANDNMQAANQLSPGAGQSVLDPFFILYGQMTEDNLQMARENLQMAQDNVEFTPANVQTAQVNISQATSKLQAAQAASASLGRGDATYTSLMALLQSGLQIAQANNQVALANWQLAAANAKTGNGPGTIPATTASSQASTTMQATSANANSGNTMIGPGNQIAISQMTAVIPSPPEPNYPNPTPDATNDLDANTEYRFIVTATLKELKTTWDIAKTSKGVPVTETKTFQFTTGKSLSPNSN